MLYMLPTPDISQHFRIYTTIALPTKSKCIHRHLVRQWLASLPHVLLVTAVASEGTRCADLYFLLSILSAKFVKRFSSSGAFLNSQHPVVSITGGCLPAVCVDVCHLHVTLTGVFVRYMVIESSQTLLA